MEKAEVSSTDAVSICGTPDLDAAEVVRSIAEQIAAHHACHGGQVWSIAELAMDVTWEATGKASQYEFSRGQCYILISTRMRSFLPIITFAILSLPPVVNAQQTRTTNDAVYTSAQAARGRTLYQQRCASCHGAALSGALAPPLAGNQFSGAWGGKTLSELVSKIRNTMPADDPGKLTLAQAADLVALMLETGKSPAGQTALSTDEKTLQAIVFPGSSGFPATGNMQQLMAGILFPSSNIIFNVQTHDPGVKVKPSDVSQGGFSWVDWGAGIYSGWDLVDNAAVAISESAPLLLTPRRCQNGHPAPVDRPDWIKFTQQLAEVGRAAYNASQTRSQEAVSDVTNQLADACFACHRVYRDKRGGTTSDPSNKAARCTP